jgi:hypothetical protein
MSTVGLIVHVRGPSTGGTVMMESERRRPFDRRDGRDGISGARLTILRLADHRLIPPLRASGAAASPGAPARQVPTSLHE